MGGHVELLELHSKTSYSRTHKYSVDHYVLENSHSIAISLLTQVNNCRKMNP